ncbi:MAG: hypothetical protein ACLTV6_13885 [Christensenellales bacterium]
MQTYLSDWDKFNEVAAKAAEKGGRMPPATTTAAPSPTTFRPWWTARPSS